MTCCIVGLLILSLVGRIRRVTGGVQTPELFAPVARRPAPGQPLTELASTGSDMEESAPTERSPVLRYCALAIAICLVGYPLLARSGVVVDTGSTVAWALRSALYLAVLIAAVVLGRSTVIWRAPSGLGTLLVVAGAVIFELGVIDMHVFRLFSVDRSDVVLLMVFHNLGPLIVMIGGLVLYYGAVGRRKTSLRSARSTVTSARPSSSAVTVSSTPPVTT